MADQTVEDRLARLEALAEKLIAWGREHPAGRVILRKLGIE